MIDPEPADARIEDAAQEAAPVERLTDPRDELEPPDWALELVRGRRPVLYRFALSLERLTRARRHLRLGDVWREFRAVADERVEKLGRRQFAPQFFVVYVNSADQPALEHVATVAPHQLEQEYVDHARQRGWRLAAEPRVRWTTAEWVEPGDVRVAAWSTPFAETPRLPPIPLALTVVHQSRVLVRWKLEGDLVRVGTHMENDICLNVRDLEHPEGGFLIGHRHAVIRRTEDARYVLHDGNVDGRPSRNGTYVNGTRLPSAGSIELRAGMRIVLGGLRADGSPKSGAALLVVEEDVDETERLEVVAS